LRLLQLTAPAKAPTGRSTRPYIPLFFKAERLAFLRADPTVRVLAEMGVLILLFDVGLEADLRAFARVGTSSVVVALIGVMVPIGLGWSAALWLLPASPMVVHLFVGATLSATGVGITARVPKDLGTMHRPEGSAGFGSTFGTRSRGSSA
jgi:Kef-type K+ transport system membrane component KefB